MLQTPLQFRLENFPTQRVDVPIHYHGNAMRADADGGNDHDAKNMKVRVVTKKNDA